MQKTTKWGIVILILLFLLFLGLVIYFFFYPNWKAPNPIPSTSTPTSSHSTSPSATTSNALSLSSLKNATCVLDGVSYTLVNGEAAGKESGVGAVDLIEEFIAYNNGSAENSDKAAIIVDKSYTAAGQLYYLCVQGIENNKPKFLDSKLIDDRAKIHTLTMDSQNKIIITATVHTVADPACCPTLESTLNFQLTSSDKLQTGF